MSSTIAARKSKARRLQQWVAQKISDLTSLEWGVDCPIESRPMGQNGCDIRLDKTARILFPYSCECKNAEKWSVSETIEQAKANCYEGTDWVLFLSKNRYKHPIAIMDAEIFFDLLSQIKQLNSQIKQLRGRRK